MDFVADDYGYDYRQVTMSADEYAAALAVDSLSYADLVTCNEI
jgi:hypothetical protein